MNLDFDVVIIGAGAARLMCAIESGRRGRRLLLLDHAEKLAKKFVFLAVGFVILQILIPMLRCFCPKTSIFVNRRSRDLVIMILLT